MSKRFGRRRKVALDALSVVVSITLASLVVVALKPAAPTAGLASIYLPAVLFVAIRRGLAAALATALGAAFAFNFFFLEPFYRLTIARSGDAVTFVVLLIAALVVGRLAVTARRQTDEAELRAELASAREQEALIVAEAASALVQEDALERQLVAIARAVASMGGPDLRLAFGSDPAPRQGEIATSLPSETRSAWLYATTSVGWRQAELERLATLLARLVDLGVERDRARVEAAEAEAARRGDAAKTAVLHAISHDLRSPITAIRTASQALALGGLGRRDEGELLTAVEEESERLSRLVEDLLDLSRIEAGAVTARSDWCDLADVVAIAAEQVRQRHGEHPISLELPSDFPLIRADPFQLERVFANLIENAVKFSPAGASVRVTGDVGHDKLTVAVIDRGPGIPASIRAAAFEPFVRGPRDQNRGSGLGLAICRGFVEANGGEIAVGPNTERGATFAVSFPLVEQPVTAA